MAFETDVRRSGVSKAEQKQDARNEEDGLFGCDDSQYLFDERESIREYITVTRKWWAEESQHFDVVVSEETIAELSEGDYPHQAEILAFVA